MGVINNNFIYKLYEAKEGLTWKKGGCLKANNKFVKS
jgi:hypothetical protein